MVRPGVSNPGRRVLVAAEAEDARGDLRTATIFKGSFLDTARIDSLQVIAAHRLDGVDGL